MPDLQAPDNYILLPESHLPVPKAVGLGLQHVLAMFGSTILGPLLMGFNPNVAVFFSGLATIGFYFYLNGRVPSYLGSSFSFIAAVVAATNYSGSFGETNPHIDIALSGIMAAGALYACVGVIVSLRGHAWIEKTFPPLVTGTIIAAIGLNLAHAAVTELSNSIFSGLFGLFTLAVTAILALRLPSGIRSFSIIISIVACYVIYLICANTLELGPAISFSHLAKVDWFGLPPFTIAKWDTTSVSLIAPVFIVLVAENLGHMRAIGTMCHTNMDPYIGKAFTADGIATMVAGFFGGTGVTTYAENIGVMSATGNFNSRSLLIAGCIAIFLGVSPKFGALLQTIPVPLLGGLSFVLFGLIAGTALRMWFVAVATDLFSATAHIMLISDPSDHDNRKRIERLTMLFGQYATPARCLTVGVPLVMSAGDLNLKIGHFAIGGITISTLAAIILYHLFVTSGSKSRALPAEWEHASDGA